MFNYAISDELMDILEKIKVKDKNTFLAVINKIEKIVNNTDTNHYKNLKHDLSNYKRVHINKSFVLLFNVNIEQNFILFDKLKHHDDAYR
jgi:mRNA-degrading endonuclease RelE of RelBE toxin-antitoxin system